jgi:uncharacterized protein YbaR (Trm112 family)
MNEELLSIMACPVCKGDLEYREDSQTIKCLKCKRVYPIREGIPIMLEEEAKIEENQET